MFEDVEGGDEAMERECGFGFGMTAAMVKKAKLWKACLGVLRATEAREEKWKEEGESMWCEREDDWPDDESRE